MKRIILAENQVISTITIRQGMDFHPSQYMGGIASRTYDCTQFGGKPVRIVVEIFDRPRRRK